MMKGIIKGIFKSDSCSRVISNLIFTPYFYWIMRRRTSEKGSVLAMASVSSLLQKPSVYQRTRSSNHYNSEEQEQLAIFRRKESRELPIKFRVKRKEQPNLSAIVEVSNPLLSRELKKAHEEIAEIKDAIKKQRNKTEGPSETKLNQFISLLRDTINQKQGQGQQIYYPVPMPVPYIMQNQHSLPAIQSSRRVKYSRASNTRQTTFSSPIRDPSRDRNLRALRIKKNMGKWKRAANAVLFWIYLKRFCKEVQKSRLFLFNKFAKNYTGGFKNVVKMVKEKMSALFKVLMTKNDIGFAIEKGERAEIRREKQALMRGLIKMVVDGLSSSFSSNSQQISKFLYFICRHGSYSCTMPLLTFEQLELSCISNSFRYISADANLEKAALINLFFFKILIYNILLSPFQLPSYLNSQTVKENLLLISSVVYELGIEVQDEYLVKVPKSYKIGNFQSFDFVKMSEAMVVQHGQHRPGQVISGLVGQTEVRTAFGLEDWGQQKKMIKILLHGIGESFKVVHRRLIERHY